MRVLEEERPVPPANHEEQVARARERHAKILERHEGDALHPARALIEKNRARREGGE